MAFYLEAMTDQRDFFEPGHAPEDRTEPPAPPAGTGGFDQHAAPPTREAGLQRLADFVPSTGRAYASERNHDYGPGRRANISGLSPYTRRRLVTEDEIVRATLDRWALSTTEKFVQEVCWRTYWKGWLERRPSAWTDYQAELRADAQQLEKEAGLRSAYEDAVAGRAGIEGFDDWARELVETGYLHNHARMWFASIWVFTLRLPWSLGADFFLRHLLDGDPASNTLGWKWIAGLQTLGKNYVARASNIRKYTDGRFAPQGLNETASPLDGAVHGKAAPPPQSDPIDPDAPTLLLVTDEDGRPEETPLSGVRPLAIAGLRASAPPSPFDWADPPRAFAEGAVVDALDRAAAAFDAPSEGVLSTDRIGERARALGAQQVAVAWTPVGATADRVSALARSLAPHNIRLVRRLRDWDAAFWPHAAKGFFG
ncbi:MAG: FAD-binding domain-containing protein, partial [Pseudomonadota bacterium]